MSRLPSNRPPCFPERDGRSCAGFAGSRCHGRRSDRADSSPLLRALHRQRHVAPEIGAWPQRVELVSHRRAQRRIRLWQVDGASQPLPETTQLHGRTPAPERSKSGPAYLLRYVAYRRPAAQSEARDLQLGRTRSSGGAAHQAVLPAAFVGTVDRCRDRVPLPHGHDLLQPGRTADSGGKQPAPRIRPLVSR